MKNLFKITFILLWSGLSLTAQAQDDIKKKEITFNVSGICEMCKDRIENALDIKGVKFAHWDIETKKCKVIFDPRKVSEDDLHSALTKAGHDTEKMKATDEQYEGLHGCCKYRDGKACD